MAESTQIPDQAARVAAGTTFDRNVVVIAGAGTGKTTLLVNRLLYLLMRRPDPLELSQIVALTFTNKAATEMKQRLRERLRALVSREGRDGQTGSGTVSIAEFRTRYGWTTDEIVVKAEAALRDIEKAQIGTLHSFAAHLLRLYPIEAGVTPTFQTDEDGSRFEEHFADEWNLWLDRELGPTGCDHARWRLLLETFRLDELRGLAYSLHSDLIDLDGLTEQVSETSLGPAMREWLVHRLAQADDLLARYDRPKRRKIEQMLAAVVELYGLLLSHGLDGLRTLSPETQELLAKDLGAAPTGWTDEDFASVEALQRIAKRVLTVDHELLQRFLAVFSPFVRGVRKSFLDFGRLTFDGLLARARTLLRDHPAVREQLKRDYRALLVDEFQDTDPVQYEIVLYLAERLEQQAASWREAELEPGKLFIVGDPKQSIYAFRRADIEAFDHVVERLERSGALRCELATNFRSHAEVLQVVNGVFNVLLVAQPAVQPPNVPLTVQPDRSSSFRNPGVELRLVASQEDDELDSAAATRVEAEQLALLIARLLQPGQAGATAAGPATTLRPGHIALLFRKLTQAESYLEALRRHGIHFTVDGEKHFYRRQEVIDLVNILRCVDNPHDSIALVGLLRSSLGGLPDSALVDLQELQALDYRLIDRLAAWTSPHADPLRHLYGILSQLHESAPRCPLPEAVDLIFERLPLLELAAASLHGEQAVANLSKVRRMAADLADRPGVTLNGFVELMMARLAEQPEEAESALAEDTLDAVRILTIHKAKGLEFPLVILVGLHHGDGTARGPARPIIWHDWSTGVQGLDLGDRCSLGAVLSAEKARIREQAERRRLFYVGMTRARERLVLSGALPKRPARGALLELLERATGVELGRPEQPNIPVGKVYLRQTVFQGDDRPPSRQRSQPVVLEEWEEGDALSDLWRRRDHEWQAQRSVSLSVSPSDFIRKPAPVVEREPDRTQHSGLGKAAGTAIHRLLQYWDFSADAEAQVVRVNRASLALDAQEDERTKEIIAEGVRDLLRTFVRSSPYDRLHRATVVGREVPFLMPWNEGRQILEGVIDLLYRLDGELWIADYKTDMIPLDQIEARAETYREQARLYQAAVARSLGQPVAGFEFIFVRLGVAVRF
ncbi:MAG: ATP-dependent helicase/nuclease AddAB, subunit A [Nitrospira sp.]|nr:MAG: ATP-dependent helicase/nuclease AddAB, subunit A [Nitrospira sp.]